LLIRKRLLIFKKIFIIYILLVIFFAVMYQLFIRKIILQNFILYLNYAIIQNGIAFSLL